MKTILLVEDEPAIRGLLARALTGDGYHVLEARHGGEALDRFDESVDLAIVDLRLPHASGPEVIAQLREQRPALKVLAMSGYALNAPAGLPFLAKPFSREDLLKAVRELLDGE